MESRKWLRDFDPLTYEDFRLRLIQKLVRVGKEYAQRRITWAELGEELKAAKQWAVDALFSPEQIAEAGWEAFNSLSPEEQSEIMVTNIWESVLGCPSRLRCPTVPEAVVELAPEEIAEEEREARREEQLRPVLEQHPVIQQIRSIIAMGGSDLITVGEAQQVLFQTMKSYGVDAIAVILDAMRLPGVNLGSRFDPVDGHWFVDIFINSLAKRTREQIESRFVS